MNDALSGLALAYPVDEDILSHVGEEKTCLAKVEARARRTAHIPPILIETGSEELS